MGWRLRMFQEEAVYSVTARCFQVLPRRVDGGYTFTGSRRLRKSRRL